MVISTQFIVNYILIEQLRNFLFFFSLIGLCNVAEIRLIALVIWKWFIKYVKTKKLACKCFDVLLMIKILISIII